MKTFKLWVLLCIVVTLLVFLAACALALPESSESPATEEPAEPTVELVPTEAPAVAEPTQALEPTRPLIPTPLPTRPYPTPPQPTPSPGLIIEERLVELEWPVRMRLGDSDVIRLSLVPAKEGYIVETDFEQHQTISETVQVPRPGGYDLFAAARLDGVGFTISPPGEEELYVPPDEAITWRWSLTPRNPGQQRLSLMLKLRWNLADHPDRIVRETVVYSRSLDVKISSFLGLSHSQAMSTGWLGFIFGGCLLLIAFFARPRPSDFAAIRKDLNAPVANKNLIIDLRPGMVLSTTERTLLQTLFNRYGRLIIECEFLSGYSGARTFLALPVRFDGRTDAYTIAKIGDKGTIQREYQNYETYVKDTLPPITARIQHTPVTLHPSTKQRLKIEGYAIPVEQAALQYTFIGEPGTMPTSLQNVLGSSQDPTLLNKLFDTFGPNWWMQHRPYVFRLALEYDRLLPTHLVIQPVKARGQELDGRKSPAELRLENGDIVLLRHFKVTEKRTDGQSLSLVGESIDGQPPLRVRWLSLAPPNGATGKIVATRQSLLESFTKGMDLFKFPDPIARIPGFLEETINGTKSTIHGDLNLENILVGPGNLVWLIDFANTREGHTLFDFAHLAAEIIAHILASHFNHPEIYLDWMRDTSVFLEISGKIKGTPTEDPDAILLMSLHDIARRCLFNPSQPREYKLSLAITCLGALKYVNLTPHSRHLLYLTAAHLAEQI